VAGLHDFDRAGVSTRDGDREEVIAWLEDITDEEWNRDLREEVDLVFFLTRAAWPHLKASHGVVVNTASLNGLMSFKMLGSLAQPGRPDHHVIQFIQNRRGK
jgi:NAD(P)-dependent dehydrogenase (short-subunit alcohol dehydrogenase family)